MIKNVKTYSRQVGVCLFIWLGYLTYDPSNIKLVEALVWPIFTFNLFAFGFKQPAVGDFMQQPRPSSTLSRRGYERSGEYPDREEQYTDDRANK